VEVTPQTRLTKAYLGVRGKSGVKNLADGVEVINASTATLPRFGRDGLQPPRIDTLDRTIGSSTFREKVRQLYDLTKREISSLQGIDLVAAARGRAAGADQAQSFVVDRVQADPQLRSDYPQPTPAAELPKLAFRALEYIPNDGLGRRDVQATLRGYTLGGPTNDAPQPLPSGVIQAVADPVRKKVFGLASQELVEVDLANDRAIPLAPGPDAPGGLAFDTKRDRLLVAGKRLFAFHSADGRWTALAEFEQLRPFALAYDPGEDALFAVGSSRDRGQLGKYVLARLDERGAAVGTVQLSDPVFPGVFGNDFGALGGDVLVQLVAAEKELVVVATHIGSRARPYSMATYMYLIDPKTGAARLTWRFPER
jgi:hypothetical protein